MNYQLAVYPVKNYKVNEIGSTSPENLAAIRGKLYNPKDNASLCKHFWNMGSAYDVDKNGDGLFVEYEYDGDEPMCLVHSVDDDGCNVWFEHYPPCGAREIIRQYIDLFEGSSEPYILAGASDIIL